MTRRFPRINIPLTPDQVARVNREVDRRRDVSPTPVNQGVVIGELIDNGLPPLGMPVRAAKRTRKANAA